MTSSILNLDQSPEELNEVYRTNYYWYLDSKPYRKAFLKRLGKIINDIGLRCVDVACGEGWLADYVRVPYMGFDGSVLAIHRAKKKRRHGEFHVGRIERPSLSEKPTCFIAPFATIVFGNLLAVVVKPRCHVAFLESYLRFWPRYFIVYDLETVDTSAIQERFTLTAEHHAVVNMPEIEEVKRHRKIEVYRCK